VRAGAAGDAAIYPYLSGCVCYSACNMAKYGPISMHADGNTGRILYAMPCHGACHAVQAVDHASHRLRLDSGTGQVPSAGADGARFGHSRKRWVSGTTPCRQGGPPLPRPSSVGVCPPTRRMYFSTPSNFTHPGMIDELRAMVMPATSPARASMISLGMVGFGPRQSQYEQMCRAA
jgi:hypothetical protein